MCKSLLRAALELSQLEVELIRANRQMINSRSMDKGPEGYESVDPKQMCSCGDL